MKRKIVFYIKKSQGKKSLVRYIHSWEDNINMDLREVRFVGTQWIRLALDGVQFLENLKTAKNFYYEKVKWHF